jgi:hypothetical protein
MEALLTATLELKAKRLATAPADLLAVDTHRGSFGLVCVLASGERTSRRGPGAHGHSASLRTILAAAVVVLGVLHLVGTLTAKLLVRPSRRPIQWVPALTSTDEAVA